MTHPGSRRLVRVARRAGLVAATLLVTLAGLELVLRLFDLRPLGWAHGVGEAYKRPLDGPLGWELIPGSVGHQRYPAWAGGAQLDVRMHINAQGWRGPEADPERDPGRLRIACAGDSFTFGTGVQDDETLPAQLAAELAGRAQVGLEVFNWGVEAYDTSQEAELLAQRIPRWLPDVVVLTYFLNDAVHPDAPVPPPPPLLKRVVLSQCGSDPSPVAAWLRAHSWVAQWTAQRLVFALTRGRQALAEDALYDESNPGWTKAREGLRRVRDLCRAHDCRLLVVLYPRLSRLDGALVGDAAYARVAEFCRAEEIEVFDLSPAFADLAVEEFHVHPLDPHPDARGHAVAARALALRIDELGWLERERPPAQR
jgi:lysophospholipase L1-like esterase